METSAQTRSTVRAFARNTLPQALHRSVALQAAGRDSSPWAGCPSFGGQRTRVATRKRYARAHAIRVSSSELGLRISLSPKYRASAKAAQDTAPQESAGLAVTSAIPAVPQPGARAQFVPSPARPNPAVKRTSPGYAGRRRLPLR